MRRSLVLIWKRSRLATGVFTQLTKLLVESAGPRSQLSSRAKSLGVVVRWRAARKVNAFSNTPASAMGVRSAWMPCSARVRTLSQSTASRAARSRAREIRNRAMNDLANRANSVLVTGVRNHPGGPGIVNAFASATAMAWRISDRAESITTGYGYNRGLAANASRSVNSVTTKAESKYSAR